MNSSRHPDTMTAESRSSGRNTANYLRGWVPLVTVSGVIAGIGAGYAVDESGVQYSILPSFGDKAVGVFAGMMPGVLVFLLAAGVAVNLSAGPSRGAKRILRTVNVSLLVAAMALMFVPLKSFVENAGFGHELNWCVPIVLYAVFYFSIVELVAASKADD